MRAGRTQISKRRTLNVIRLATVVFLASSAAANAQQCSYVNKEGSTATLSQGGVAIRHKDGTSIDCQTYGTGTGVPIMQAVCGDDDNADHSSFFFVAHGLKAKSEDILILLDEAWYPTAGC